MNIEKMKWIICPKCGEKTRVKVKETTVMKDFPLFCTWCKQETLIEVKKFNVKIVEKDK